MDRSHSEPGPVLMTGDMRDPTVALKVDRKDSDINGHLKLKALPVLD